MKEIWKDIPNYVGFYLVSNIGRIKSLPNKDGYKKTERILKPVNRAGYLQVGLSRKGKTKLFQISRLVLIAFVGNSNLQCNHKNGIKTDNRLENLEWCTPYQNIRHSIETGLKKSAIGYDLPQTKLTISQVRRIRFIHKNIKVEPGYWKKIAKSLGVYRTALYDIKYNITWKHVHAI